LRSGKGEQQRLVVGELGLVLHARTQTNRRSFPLEAEGHLLLLRRAENLRHPAKNAQAAESENLAAAFENDVNETEEQVRRLENVSN
jgi:hypothetical protein